LRREKDWNIKKNKNNEQRRIKEGNGQQNLNGEQDLILLD